MRVFAIAPDQVRQTRSLVLVRWPLPIVVSPGAVVPVCVFALIFVAFSGTTSPSMLAATALLGGIGGIISLVIHELGHVSISRRLSGVRPEKVSVMCLGAAAHFEGEYRNGREQARMALGGPEASFAFALALTIPLFLPAPGSLKIAALALALLNGAIGALSLLPVHPLDGHKVVVGLVWWAIGSEDRARGLVRRVGKGLLAVDLSFAVLLLAERPALGLTVIAIAAVAYCQKRFVRAPRTT